MRLLYSTTPPRSATVTTLEPCSLLEIQGPYLNDLVFQHPEIELKFLTHLSTQLRDLGDMVMAVKVKDVDEKIQAVHSRLDAELKVFDVSLKAAQTVFEHTSTRASEVIDSVERSRSRMTTMASTIAGVLSTVVAIFGFMGINEFKDIMKFKEDIITFKKDIKISRDEIVVIKNELQQQNSQLKKEILDSNQLISRIKKEMGYEFGSKVLLSTIR